MTNVQVKVAPSIFTFAPTGTYVMCKYDNSTCNEIHEWAKEQQIPKPLDKDKIHSTIIHSSVPIHDDQHLFDRETETWHFTAKSFMLMPTRFKSLSGEPEGALIAMLHAPELEELHQQMLDNGATHHRDTYEPHVAISYFVPKTIVLEKLPLPTFKFNPSKIIFEPIDIDWMSH